MRFLILDYLILSLCMISFCANPAIAQESSTGAEMFDSALQLFEENSIRKDSIDWDELKARFLPIRDTISSQSSAYALIDSLIQEVNDGHSFLYYQGKKTSWSDGTTYPESKLVTRMVNPNTAFIRIPSIGAQEPEELLAETTAIRDALCNLLNREPNYLIVDLTRDYGGNMYPMMLGTQPVIGKGIVGYFHRSPGDSTAWVLGEYELLFDENSILNIESLDTCSTSPDLKVAVLINEFTISSGEALAVALRGIPNSVFIGKPSQGATTANQTFPLSDKAMLFLTGAIYADRTGKVYGGSIIPDLEVDCKECSTEEFDEAAISAAIKWFRGD